MNLYDYGSQFLQKGIREIAGPSSHPQILAWLKRTEALYPTDLSIDDSKYAWCGVFVGNMVLDLVAQGAQMPAPPQYFQGARNWTKWGKKVPTETAQKGDVVVLRRPGGHHVAIVKELGTADLTVLGGNQGDALTIARYALDKVVEVRRG